MADTQTIRGSEIEGRFIVKNKIARTMTAIKSGLWTPQFEIIREGYWGEQTDRRDDSYGGSSLEITLHPEDNTVLTLIQLFIDRASRRVAQADARVDFTFRWNFPNGQRPRVTLVDVKTGPIPVELAERRSLVNVKFSFETETTTISPTG